jgi:hypothetical protein
MCTYLNRTGATYYFRRPVPDDLLGHFRTERGNPPHRMEAQPRNKGPRVGQAPPPAPCDRDRQSH